jgi:hypothetical protein
MTLSEEKFIEAAVQVKWKAFEDALFEQIERCNDAAVTPSDILQMVRNAVYSARNAKIPEYDWLGKYPGLT